MTPSPDVRTVPFLPDLPGVFCLILFLTLAFLAGERALADGDTLWHIKAGLVMIERGEILTRDIFSHTAFGKPWVAHEWLSEVVMAALFQWTGLAGVVLFFALIAALTFWLLYRIALSRGDEWLAFICVTLSLFPAFTHFLARPHVFTWFFGVLTLWILLQGRRWVFLLPPLTLVWANLHGGFLFGLVLQGVFILGPALERWPHIPGARVKTIFNEVRTPLLVLLLSILAAGVNPFGFHLLAIPFLVTKQAFLTGIGEWQATDFQKFWYFRLYLLLLVFLLLIRRERISWTNILLVLFFLNSALIHVRNVSLAGLFLIPFWIEALQPYTARLAGLVKRKSENKPDLRLSKRSGPLATLSLALILLISSAAWPRQREALSEVLFPLPEEYSREAVEFLAANRPAGEMFNDYSWGDYLIFALDSPQRVFIDGRADMYGEEIFEDYRTIVSIDGDVEELFNRYGVDWIIFPPDKPLVRYLKVSGAWKEIYRDDQASILLREKPLRP